MLGDRICYIISAGDYYEYPFEKRTEDLVIAVDGGYDAIKEKKDWIDVLVGDLDSIEKNDYEGEVVKLVPEKDETDTLVAIDLARKRGYKNILLLGGTGGARISHTIANLQCLIGASDLHIFMVDRQEVIFLLKNESVFFTKEARGYLSVFAVSGECTGVTESGLKYEINNAVLTPLFPVGVSNEFIGKESKISVECGTLMIVLERTQLPYVKM